MGCKFVGRRRGWDVSLWGEGGGKFFGMLLLVFFCFVMVEIKFFEYYYWLFKVSVVFIILWRKLSFLNVRIG